MVTEQVSKILKFCYSLNSVAELLSYWKPAEYPWKRVSLSGSTCWSALSSVPQTSWSVSTCDHRRWHRKQGQALSVKRLGNPISQRLLWLLFIWNVIVTLPQGTGRLTIVSWQNMGYAALGNWNICIYFGLFSLLLGKVKFHSSLLFIGNIKHTYYIHLIRKWCFNVFMKQRQINFKQDSVNSFCILLWIGSCWQYLVFPFCLQKIDVAKTKQLKDAINESALGPNTSRSR